MCALRTLLDTDLVAESTRRFSQFLCPSSRVLPAAGSGMFHLAVDFSPTNAARFCHALTWSCEVRRRLLFPATLPCEKRVKTGFCIALCRKRPGRMLESG